MIISLRNKFLHFFDKQFSSSLISSKEILELIFPIIVDQAFFIGMAIINTAMISASGMAAISAVNMVESLNVFLINLFIAVATGGTVLIAQYRGMHNREMIRKATMGNITAVFLLASSIAIIIIAFHNPVLSFLFGKADDEVMGYAKIYLIGIMLSYPLSGIINASCCSLRGVGETSSSLFISLITNVSYVLLNVLFINILKMSVLGMVIALFTGRLLGATYAILYLNFKNQSLHFSVRRLYPIDFVMIKKIITIGIPFASEQAFFNGGKILTQVFIVGMGTAAITTNAISNSITLLLEIIPGSLNLALVTIVGLCVGSKEIGIAKRYIKNFMWLASGVTVLTSLLLFLLFPTLIGLYSTPDSIIPGILKITIMVAIARIFLFPASFMIPSGLRAAGDAKFTSIVSMISMWTVRVILGYILGITLNMGVFGIWLAMVLEWGVRGIIFSIRFKGTKWYQHNITE